MEASVCEINKTPSPRVRLRSNSPFSLRKVPNRVKLSFNASLLGSLTEKRDFLTAATFKS